MVQRQTSSENAAMLTKWKYVSAVARLAVVLHASVISSN